ncbi:MAG: prepilin peptidase [Candidatus Omnitrophica bacterium]|nr:prepilin peptidase [Candidatus Omnitrophota bacterium]
MVLTKIFVFIFGSLIGSFLNVCIHRLPLGESVINPPSHCPKCDKPIPWQDNIPLLSYLFLRGRCRFCKVKISLRYFIVELLTAIIFLLFYSCFGLSYIFFFYILFTCGLIVATFVDIRERIIPDEVSLGGAVCGLILNSLRGLRFFPFSFNSSHLLDSLLGIIAGSGIIYLSGFLFDLVYFKILKKPAVDGETSSMGGGDVKLMAMVGAFLGWEKAILVFFFAPFLGLLFGIANLLVKKEHVIPYGPFLSLAALLSMFWADKLIALILLR